MTAFWGDDSWKSAVYEHGLFKDLLFKAGDSNTRISKAFQTRLKKIAGFKYVPDPMPMRNSNKAIVYYLFFASHNTTGQRIVEEIFRKYRDRGGA
jgi:three-Cys-motif partner protein